MAKYLFETRYTAEGAKGVGREGGSSRRAMVEAMIKGLGGKLEAFYFAFGDVDLYTIVELPDHAAAAAVSIAVSQGGGATTKTIVLIPPEDIDRAAKKTVDYRPPGPH